MFLKNTLVLKQFSKRLFLKTIDIQMYFNVFSYLKIENWF